LIRFSWASFAPEEPAFEQTFRSDDRQRDVMFDAGGLPVGKKVSRRCLKEIENGRVLPGRGVRYIDHHRGRFQRSGESIAGNAVDSRIWRRSDSFMSKLAQFADKLRSNKPGTSNYYDFHKYLFLSTNALLSTSNSAIREIFQADHVRLREEFHHELQCFCDTRNGWNTNTTHGLPGKRLQSGRGVR
jgi:hypothetical protein